MTARELQTINDLRDETARLKFENETLRSANEKLRKELNGSCVMCDTPLHSPQKCAEWTVKPQMVQYCPKCNNYRVRHQ